MTDMPPVETASEGFAALAARLRSATPPQKTDAADIIRAARDRDFAPSE
jgi:hypothetical protein